MNLQPTRDGYNLHRVTCPDLATAYRLSAAITEIDPTAEIIRRPNDGGLVMAGPIDVAAYHRHNGDPIDSDRQFEILTAACAKVNRDRNVAEVATAFFKAYSWPESETRWGEWHAMMDSAEKSLRDTVVAEYGKEALAARKATP